MGGKKKKIPHSKGSLLCIQVTFATPVYPWTNTNLLQKFHIRNCFLLVLKHTLSWEGVDELHSSLRPIALRGSEAVQVVGEEWSNLDIQRQKGNAGVTKTKKMVHHSLALQKWVTISIRLTCTLFFICGQKEKFECLSFHVGFGRYRLLCYPNTDKL